MPTLPVGIDPVALSLAGIEVRWYGILVAVAALVAVAIALAGARRAGLAAGLVEDAAVWIMVASLVGGRVLWILQRDPSDVLANPLEVLAVWHGGLSFYGGLLAGLAALAVWSRRRGIGFGRVSDVAAPAVATGQAVGHLGCLIGGDSFGLPTAGPLAVVYSNPGTMAPRGVPLAPTQLYEAAALGALALALFFLRDDVVVLGGLKVAQLIAVGIAAAGGVWLASLIRRAGSHRALTSS